MNGKPTELPLLPEGREGQGARRFVHSDVATSVVHQNGKPPLPSPLLHPMEERE
jgi:hypothetical protein